MTFSKQEYEHYHHQIILDEIGETGQQKLKGARVLIIGLGGLGCPVALYLSGAGVGVIGLMDNDVVSVSNLTRQVLFNYDDIGQSKVMVAKSKLQKINPFIQFISQPNFLNSENCFIVVSQFDLVIDCTDNFSTKYLINDVCEILKKTWVSGSIFKTQGQITVLNHCNGPSYRCLYPTPSNLNTCSQVGVSGILPGIVGTIMANEIIKLVVNNSTSLSGKLLVVNTTDLSFSQYSFVRNKKRKQNTEIVPIELCGMQSIISADEITEKDLLIDVRLSSEHKKGNIGGVNIEIDELENSIEKIRALQNNNQRIVCYCKSGARSGKAVQLLLQKKITNVYSLKGGIG